MGEYESAARFRGREEGGENLEVGACGSGLDYGNRNARIERGNE